MKTPSKHPLRNTWYQMILRCENPENHNYRHYGARGIKVCPRWKDFDNFVADMGERPAGATLDRINGGGDYEPGNCRWADRATQHNNRRDNVKILVNGERIGIYEAGRKYGIEPRLIWARIKRLGWPEQEAATFPAVNNGLPLARRKALLGAA